MQIRKGKRCTTIKESPELLTLAKHHTVSYSEKALKVKDRYLYTTRGGEVASRQAHNLEIVGSNPTPATRTLKLLKE